MKRQFCHVNGYEASFLTQDGSTSSNLPKSRSQISSSLERDCYKYHVHSSKLFKLALLKTILYFWILEAC